MVVTVVVVKGIVVVVGLGVVEVVEVIVEEEEDFEVEGCLKVVVKIEVKVCEVEVV